MSGDTPPADPPKEVPSALSQLPETLLTRTLELCRLAKAAQLGVTPGRVIDVPSTTASWRALHILEHFTMLCSHPSFLRKQESRPPAPGLWMPDQVRHDESVTARLQPIVKRTS